MSRPGWLKLHRKITENALWEMRPFCPAAAWIDLLIRVNFAESKMPAPHLTKPVVVQPGEAIISLRSLERTWGWSRNRVIRYLARLKSEHMIETTNETAFTRLKVLKWKGYQGSEVDDGTTNGATSGTTNETEVEPHVEPQTKPIRRRKEGEEGKNLNTSSHVAGPPPSGVLKVLEDALGGNGSNGRGDPAHLERAKVQISLFKAEATQLRMAEFLGYLENNPHIPFKRMEEITRKLFALRESLNMNDGVPADQIFCYAVDEAMKNDALQPSYVGTVMRNAVIKWREGALKF